MIYGLMAALALLPTILIVGVAVVLRLALGTRAPSLQIALWIAAAVAAGYAGWQSFEFYRDSENRNVAVGSVVFIAMPLFAAAAALLAFGYTWGIATLVVEVVRLTHGTATFGGSAARCLVPLLAVAVAVYFTGVVVRPSASDRVARARTADELTPLYERALRDSDASMLQSLANSPLLPPEKLAELAGHADPWVRCRVAFNRRTPPQTLERLADDPSSDVRVSLSGNEAVSDTTLERLAARGDAGGRAASDALRVRRGTTRPATIPDSPST